MLEGVSNFSSSTMMLQPAMVLVRGVLRVGMLRLSVYGLCAAVGLIAALWLSQKSAKLVGLGAEQVWDAGWFAVTAAFVFSRLLLIVGDVRGFLRLPLVLLMLPSFTYGGMVLTGLAIVAYLRWKRLPMLRVMDAWAPCAAVVAAALSMGRYFEGTDPGMPTSLPWGPVVPGSAGLMHLHPVQMYATLAAVMLMVVLMLMLERRLRAGVVAGAALAAGGAMTFLLDMLTQPFEMSGHAWLDPAQWIALGAMVAGTLMLTFLKELA
jgi:phosphatidylglycerol:prolipoprotein diacylglycerol transferase